MTSNGGKQISDIWFGTLALDEIIVCDARSLHVSYIHATDDFEI